MKEITASQLRKGVKVVGIGTVTGIQHVHGNEFRAIFETDTGGTDSRRYADHEIVQVFEREWVGERYLGTAVPSSIEGAYNRGWNDARQRIMKYLRTTGYDCASQPQCDHRTEWECAAAMIDAGFNDDH